MSNWGMAQLQSHCVSQSQEWAGIANLAFNAVGQSYTPFLLLSAPFPITIVDQFFVQIIDSTFALSQPGVCRVAAPSYSPVAVLCLVQQISPSLNRELVGMYHYSRGAPCAVRAVRKVGYFGAVFFNTAAIPQPLLLFGQIWRYIFTVPHTFHLTSLDPLSHFPWISVMGIGCSTPNPTVCEFLPEWLRLHHKDLFTCEGGELALQD